MMEPGGTPIPLTTLSGGINRLKVRGSVSPSRLYDLVNARLTIEGTVVPREGTIRAAQLTSLTAGLVYYNGKFNVFSTTAQTVPTGYVDNILVGPNGPTDLISFIWFAKPFLGFLYVVAEFVSGAIAHFWLQSSGTWTKNTVYQVGAIVTPTTPNGLAYLATRDLLPNPTWAPDTLVTVDELVEPTVPNGYYFKATTVDGTNPHTGLTEPTWPASIGATVQEFGDYPTVTAAAPVGSTLAAGITDRYGDSADIAGIAPASTTGAVTTLPPIGLTLAPWRAGKIYPAGSIVTPTATQGAVINAIPNGDFEAGNDGNWIFTGPGQQWSISNAGVPYQGSYEAINPPGTTSALMTMNTFGVCTPGQTIKVSYYLTTGTSTGSNIQVSAKMNWYSDTGATALISTTDGGAHASQSGWTQEISTFVAPAGAITCRVAIHAASGTSSRDTAGVDLVTWDLESPAPTSNFIFEAVQSGPGTSGPTQPTWPTVDGNTVVDNTVTWQAVGSSIIIWTAAPIMESGATEPIWPTIIGQSVSDGNMSWTAISRQVTDPNLPTSVVVALGASKIFVGDKDIVAYSASVNPTDFTTPNNAGYLPTGLNNYGNNPVEVLVLYRGNLVAMNSGGYQMWQIDPDPANMALLDAQPVGSVWTLGAQSVANDTLLLTNLGLRNLGTTGATANMSTGQLGQPIDTLIQAQINAGTYYPTSLYYPARGQEWTIFGPQAFVLTVNGNSQKSWSRYVFPDSITYWTLAGEVLYLRSAGNLVWQVDAQTLQDDVITSLPGTYAVTPGSDTNFSGYNAVGPVGSFTHTAEGAGVPTYIGFNTSTNTFTLKIDGTSVALNPPPQNCFGTATVTTVSPSLLLHMDGTNGSTTFTDSSPNSLTMTASGSAAVETATVKFGTGALICGGASGNTYISTPFVSSGPLDISTGDFTIEFWHYAPTAGATLLVDYATDDNGSPNYGLWIENMGSGQIVAKIWNGGSYGTPTAGTVTTGAWHHIALVRHGNVYTLYLDGVGTTPLTQAGAISFYTSGYVRVGGSPFILGQTSYIDELRVSNGFAVYTAGFTPPSAPFSSPSPLVLQSNAATYSAVGNVATWVWTGTPPSFWPIGPTYNVTLSEAIGGFGIPFYSTMQWPFIDLTKFGLHKEMAGFDLVGDGEVTVQFAWDETDPTGFSDNAGFSTSNSVTAPYTLSAADTVPGQPIAMPINAPSYSMILTWAPNQAWTWQAAQIYAITEASGG